MVHLRWREKVVHITFAIDPKNIAPIDAVGRKVLNNRDW